MKKIMCGIVCLFGVAACDNNSSTPSTAVPPAESRTKVVVTEAPAATTPTTKPDNTAVNARDRNDAEAKTAASQGQTRSDVEITADIRRRVMDAKLSVNAQNSKIITQDGKVTLRGPVKDQSEKDAIGQIAIAVAGADKVDNQLDIQTSQ